MLVSVRQPGIPVISLSFFLLLLVNWPSLIASDRIPIEKSPDDYLVEGLEGVEPAFAQFKGKMHAGIMPTSDKRQDEGFMFWLFVPDHQRVDETMVLWLNGGPGCSSILGLLIENSPVTLGPRPPGSCCLGNNDPLRYNPFHWAKATTML